MIIVLGAGLSGISSSYHIGHDKCILFEKSNYPGGHISSHCEGGFTWDQGPHISFTKNEYVRRLFEEITQVEILEFPVKVSNYYYGNWIPHPAQTNLWALPDDLKELFFRDFLLSKDNDHILPANYYDWCKLAFGESFTDYLASKYTMKYWTTHPSNLTVDWIGPRIHKPSLEDFKKGLIGPAESDFHYIQKARYPADGGFFSFADQMYSEANIKYGYELEFINFEDRKVYFTNGEVFDYTTLINTIPLPVFIHRSSAPTKIKAAAMDLSCTRLLLINISVSHISNRDENWIYVYDSDKFSTRISITESLSPNNSPVGATGIQVEVYFSKYKDQNYPTHQIAERVIDELVEMGVIENKFLVIDYHTIETDFANIIFDHKRRDSLNKIFSYLELNGLVRDDSDLCSSTDWSSPIINTSGGSLFLAGRFAQWKYYWTDDCVLRGKQLSEYLRH
jgi:protoporphyrinogen oxidase